MGRLNLARSSMRKGAVDRGGARDLVYAVRDKSTPAAAPNQASAECSPTTSPTMSRAGDSRFAAAEAPRMVARVAVMTR
jgi:hypothetical protein